MMNLDNVTKGTRVRLLSMPNDPCPIPRGTEGEVLGMTQLHDGTTQIAMKWDSGRTLAMIVPEDSFEVIAGLYVIRVIERAIGDTVHEEEFRGSLLDAERRLGDVWNEGPASSPGRYRAELRPKDGAVVQHID